ncbi:16S rRNA (cytidine(1402)-2'-O)-methyltransferase [Breznakiellaceae bacterium SP9]
MCYGTLIVAILYIIGTPIGNLGDISFRALEVLKSVSAVACEDTRNTRKLLTHFSIQTRLFSCRSQNEEHAAGKILALLDAQQDLAYVSDAGTPGLSDPGALLTRIVSKAGHQVIPIPGPSAFASVLSAAGGLDKSVLFEGFLSPKPGRRRARLAALLDMELAFIIYESPFRIIKLFEDLSEINTTRYVCVGREMTKIHEEYIRGSILEVYELIKGRPEQKGEFSIYISGKNAD